MTKPQKSLKNLHKTLKIQSNTLKKLAKNNRNINKKTLKNSQKTLKKNFKKNFRKIHKNFVKIPKKRTKRDYETFSFFTLIEILILQKVTDKCITDVNP
jgi:DNA-binding ferritin-like protein (Dps family)